MKCVMCNKEYKTKILGKFKIGKEEYDVINCFCSKKCRKDFKNKVHNSATSRGDGK